MTNSKRLRYEGRSVTREEALAKLGERATWKADALRVEAAFQRPYSEGQSRASLPDAPKQVRRSQPIQPYVIQRDVTRDAGPAGQGTQPAKENRGAPGGAKIGHFDAVAFYAALEKERLAKSLTWKEVARAAGVSPSTLKRMSLGKRPDVDSLAALASWSGVLVDAFVVPVVKGSLRKPSPIGALTAHLRSDPFLSPESAAALEAIVKAAYERLRKE